MPVVVTMQQPRDYGVDGFNYRQTFFSNLTC